MVISFQYNILNGDFEVLNFTIMYNSTRFEFIIKHLPSIIFRLSQFLSLSLYVTKVTYKKVIAEDKQNKENTKATGKLHLRSVTLVRFTLHQCY